MGCTVSNPGKSGLCGGWCTVSVPSKRWRLEILKQRVFFGGPDEQAHPIVNRIHSSWRSRVWHILRKVQPSESEVEQPRSRGISLGRGLAVMLSTNSSPPYVSVVVRIDAFQVKHAEGLHAMHDSCHTSKFPV
jgi:hypothetical protein